MSKMKEGGAYIPSLTGVRAVAAYLVFFHHFNPFPVATFLGGLINEGHIGVTIFFVLSGFLISLRYSKQVVLSKDWFKKYFKNRFARIYPLYAILTIISFLLIWTLPFMNRPWQGNNLTNKFTVLLFNLTFLRGFFDQLKYTGIAQGWTLTVEECFYALMPFILLFIVRYRSKYLGLFSSAVMLMVMGCALVKLAPHPLGFFDSYTFMFTRTFLGRAFEFMLGAALALFIQKRGSARGGILISSTGFVWILGVIWVLSLLTARQIPSLESPIGILINNVILPFGVAMLFYGLITERTWLRKLLETPLLQILGKSSYAFYLIHMGVFELLIRHYILDNTYFIFLIIIVLAILFWKWVEEPLNKVIRNNSFI